MLLHPPVRREPRRLIGTLIVLLLPVLLFLNGMLAAHGKQQVTAPTSASTVTTVVKDTPVSLKTNATTLPSKQTSTMTHTVMRGETYSRIAAKHGIDHWQDIRSLNKTDPTKLRVGQKLLLPTSSGSAGKMTVMSVPKSQDAPAPSVSNGSHWDRLAQCESGGNWSINTGNSFYGGLQFTLSSWRAVGGKGMPHQASREEQILRGMKLQAIQGWGAWPVCSRKIGLR